MSSPNNSGKRSLLGALSSWEDTIESLKKQKSDAETQDRQRKVRENEQEARAASIPELQSPRKVVEEYVNEELVEENGYWLLL